MLQRGIDMGNRHEKHAAHPEKMSIGSDELIHYCDESGFDSLSIANRHVQTLETPKRPKDAPAHNDSFDRIILTQAKTDGLFHNMRLANTVLRRALHSGCSRVIQKKSFVLRQGSNSRPPTRPCVHYVH